MRYIVLKCITQQQPYCCLAQHNLEAVLNLLFICFSSPNQEVTIEKACTFYPDVTGTSK